MWVYVCLCTCVHESIQWHLCVSQRIACGDWFSPSAVDILRIVPGMAASTFILNQLAGHI